jgi:hypothetical protein
VEKHYRLREEFLQMTGHVRFEERLFGRRARFQFSVKFN